MHRRTFASAVIAALVVGGRGQRAAGDVPDVLLQGDRRPLSLRLEGGRSVLVREIRLGRAGLRWDGSADLYDENRADFSVVPGLGGLFRPAFRNRWAAARPLGAVALVGDALVGAVESGEFAGRRVSVGAGQVCWDIPARLVPMPEIGVRGQPVGALRVEADGTLLISVQADPLY
ncbi:MAG: hypothetical protein H6898_05395 [Rhodobacter sp.]|nr:hypothetical protein [Rhodobacter sp.]